MDFFTHLLIGVIIASLADGSKAGIYIASSIFMVILPDLDFFMAPLWKKHPFLGHHGITHTPVFVIAASLLFYGILLALGGRSDIRLFLVIMLAGISHIAGDLLGTGGVPLFYPFSKKYFKLNMDLGINPVLMVFSFAGTTVLLAANLSKSHFEDTRGITTLLGSAFILYYASRAILKVLEERMEENRGFIALPTVRPDRWKFARRTETQDAITIVLKTDEGIQTFRIPKDKRDRIKRCEDLPYTYWHPIVQEEMRFFEYPCYKTSCRKGRMEITWNSAEAGKLFEIRVVCENGGLSACKMIRGRRTRF